MCVLIQIPSVPSPLEIPDAEEIDKSPQVSPRSKLAVQQRLESYTPSPLPSREDVERRISEARERKDKLLNDELTMLSRKNIKVPIHHFA